MIATTIRLWSTNDPAADVLVGFYVFILFALLLLARECLTGRKPKPRR
jgi:hypothetical protein